MNACTENRNAASFVKKSSLFASVTWPSAELVGLLGSRYRVDLDEIFRLNVTFDDQQHLGRTDITQILGPHLYVFCDVLSSRDAGRRFLCNLGS